MKFIRVILSSLPLFLSISAMAESIQVDGFTFDVQTFGDYKVATPSQFEANIYFKDYYGNSNIEKSCSVIEDKLQTLYSTYEENNTAENAKKFNDFRYDVPGRYLSNSSYTWFVDTKQNFPSTISQDIATALGKDKNHGIFNYLNIEDFSSIQMQFNFSSDALTQKFADVPSDKPGVQPFVGDKGQVKTFGLDAACDIILGNVTVTYKAITNVDIPNTPNLPADKLWQIHNELVSKKFLVGPPYQSAMILGLRLANITQEVLGKDAAQNKKTLNYLFKLFVSTDYSLQPILYADFEDFSRSYSSVVGNTTQAIPFQTEAKYHEK